MIIVAPSVARNLARRALVRVLVWRVVVERDRDDRARGRQNQSRVCALFRLALHPMHLAVKAVGEPFLKPLAFTLQRTGANDAHYVEAFGASLLFDLLRA